MKEPAAKPSTKRRRASTEGDDNDGQARVAHILDDFHKRQQRQQPSKDIEVKNDAQAQAEEVSFPLGPLPRPPTRSRGVGTVPIAVPQYLSKAKLVKPDVRVPFKSLSLCSHILENLERQEMTEAFAVQSVVLPALLQKGLLPEQQRDLLVSAPTGSGKTLAYVLPILEQLRTRRVTRLRAVVLVPTRELVSQVYSTFEACSRKLGLQIQFTSANRGLATEQDLLVGGLDDLPASKIDILIATPGRLVDHLKSTPGFTLDHLQYLVIDEGDRLLNQSFQSWARELELALRPITTVSTNGHPFYLESQQRCRKLIFSATMTDDPALLSELHLVDPYFLMVSEDDSLRFSVPATLSEIFVHVPDEVPKPLALLHVIKRLEVNQSLIFTNSNEAAHRLSRLADMFDIGGVLPFTSNMTNGERKRRLQAFAAGEVCHLVCSDLMARGVDTTTPAVINYDASVPPRQYVHRVGRTARAGKSGLAVSIVARSEDKYWWNQVGKKIGRSTEIDRKTLFPRDASEEMPELRQRYEEALRELQFETE
ncbi:hypothetical protein PYCC9005_001715 [Savitreella phatthalungensis]